MTDVAKYVRLLFAVFLVFASCNKITKRSIIGTYSGTLRYYHEFPYASGQPTIDSYSQCSFEVVKSDIRDIEILNNHFFIDSLRDGYTTYLNTGGIGGNYILLKEDSLICHETEYFKMGHNSFYEYRTIKNEK